MEVIQCPVCWDPMVQEGAVDKRPVSYCLINRHKICNLCVPILVEQNKPCPLCQKVRATGLGVDTACANMADALYKMIIARDKTSPPEESIAPKPLSPPPKIFALRTAEEMTAIRSPKASCDNSFYQTFGFRLLRLVPGPADADDSKWLRCIPETEGLVFNFSDEYTPLISPIIKTLNQAFHKRPFFHRTAGGLVLKEASDFFLLALLLGFSWRTLVEEIVWIKAHYIRWFPEAHFFLGMELDLRIRDQDVAREQDYVGRFRKAVEEGYQAPPLLPIRKRAELKIWDEKTELKIWDEKKFLNWVVGKWMKSLGVSIHQRDATTEMTVGDDKVPLHLEFTFLPESQKAYLMNVPFFVMEYIESDLILHGWKEVTASSADHWDQYFASRAERQMAAASYLSGKDCIVNFLTFLGMHREDIDNFLQ